MGRYLSTQTRSGVAGLFKTMCLVLAGMDLGQSFVLSADLRGPGHTRALSCTLRR